MEETFSQTDKTEFEQLCDIIKGKTLKGCTILLTFFVNCHGKITNTSYCDEESSGSQSNDLPKESISGISVGQELESEKIFGEEEVTKVKMLKLLSYHLTKYQVTSMSGRMYLPEARGGTKVCKVTYRDKSVGYFSKKELCRILRESIIATNFLMHKVPKEMISIKGLLSGDTFKHKVSLSKDNTFSSHFYYKNQLKTPETEKERMIVNTSFEIISIIEETTGGRVTSIELVYCRTRYTFQIDIYRTQKLFLADCNNFELSNLEGQGISSFKNSKIMEVSSDLIDKEDKTAHTIDEYSLPKVKSLPSISQLNSSPKNVFRVRIPHIKNKYEIRRDNSQLMSVQDKFRSSPSIRHRVFSPDDTSLRNTTYQPFNFHRFKNFVNKRERNIQFSHLPPSATKPETFGKYLKGEYVHKNHGLATTLGVPKSFLKSKRPQKYIDRIKMLREMSLSKSSIPPYVSIFKKKK
ncbi:unnamed protein product [Moneuplotes crassus]|uniref:Uncharacterized protein n=1 Tax=Euplotes crassus TaxID=5936 RepID=A0AAD1U8R3_EUPCR|nr:unnamed protein product [Moneuplotes crassus]